MTYRRLIIDILRPRLDCTFKEGAVPDEAESIGSLPPIRLRWLDFATLASDALRSAGHDVKTIVEPLWMMDPESGRIEADIVLVPHRDLSDWPRSSRPAVPLFYMQTSVPHLFSVDPDGWAAGSRQYSHGGWVSPDRMRKWGGGYDMLRSWAAHGNSKFDQSHGTAAQAGLTPGYILFTCQLPHDVVIRRHSDVSVEAALAATIKAAEKAGRRLVVKGHPINRESMAPLERMVRANRNSVWFDHERASLMSLIDMSQALVTVNSGTGMEALLRSRPVYLFGRAEYDQFVSRNTGIDQFMASLNDFSDLGIGPCGMVSESWRFFDAWYEWVHDTTRFNAKRFVRAVEAAAP